MVVVVSSGSNGHFIFKHSWGLAALKGTGVGSVIFIVVWSRAQVTFSKSCTKWTVGLSSLCRPLKLCCWRNSNLISEIVPTLNGGVYVAIIVETEGSVYSKVCHAHQRYTLTCQVPSFLPSNCSRDDAGSSRNPCFSLTFEQLQVNLRSLRNGPEPVTRTPLPILRRYVSASTGDNFIDLTFFR